MFLIKKKRTNVLFDNAETMFCVYFLCFFLIYFFKLFVNIYNYGRQELE